MPVRVQERPKHSRAPLVFSMILFLSVGIWVAVAQTQSRVSADVQPATMEIIPNSNAASFVVVVDSKVPATRVHSEHKAAESMTRDGQPLTPSIAVRKRPVPPVARPRQRGTLPRIALATVGVGRRYLAHERQRLLHQSCYALVNNMTRIIESRDLFSLEKSLNETEGPLLGKYASNLHEWYDGHGWKWAWTKPIGMLAMLLDPPPPPPDVTVKDDGSWFDWILYMDPDVAIESFASLVPIFEQLDAAAARTGRPETDYHIIYSSGKPGGERNVGGPTNNDIFLVRNTPEAVDFLRAWTKHSDCECWVDQGAFYIELMRYQARKMLEAGLVEAANATQGGGGCDHKFSAPEKEKARKFLEAKGCFKSRQLRMCTWTKPGPMMCSCSFVNCFIEGWQTLGYNMKSGEMPPPVLLVDGFPRNSPRSLLSRFGHRPMTDEMLPKECNQYTLPHDLHDNADRVPGRTIASWDRSGSQTKIHIIGGHLD